MDRRNFLKTFGIAGGTLMTGGKLRAKNPETKPEFKAVLIDTTRCAGCRNCEFVCAETNGLPEPDWDIDIFETKREPQPNQWSVMNGYETSRGEVYVKKQCMHCNQPACAAACLTKAMIKTPEGPVVWRENKCMGCRYCMVSCPFNIPKFEYDSPVPKILKCRMCLERLEEGQQPACVENCPAEALTFGNRRDLIRTARKRIYDNPDQYVDHIYGENEVGGTGFLYLASVPFEELGFKTDVGEKPLPELTTDFLYGVPIVLALWPAFLIALNKSTKRNEENIEDGE